MSPAHQLPTVLTIAGSDPSGGAGIQGDLKTIQRLGSYGMAVIAGLTAQSTLGVTGTHGVPAAFVVDQLQTLWADAPPLAAKTGMLATNHIVQAVADFLRDHPIPLVVDPVMVSTSGARLLSEDAVETIRRQLIPRATLVTPNAQEAEVLVGNTIKSEQDLRDAARALLAMGPKAVLIKGGDSDLGGLDSVIELLWEQGLPEPVLWKSLRHSAGPHRSFHGSGCCMAAAAATALAHGLTIRRTVEVARIAVLQAIRGAIPMGKGAVPVNHQAIDRLGVAG